MKRSPASIIGILSLALMLVVAALATPVMAGPAAAAAPPGDADAAPESDWYPVPYVIDGTPTTVESWPSMAALAVEGPDGLSQICGGTLIRADLVVTAAHCTDGYAADPTRLRVVLGRSLLSAPGGDILNVAAVIPHPTYAPDPYYQADLALVQLAERSSRPVTRIATPHTEPNWDAAPLARAAGWGRTHSEATPAPDGQLRETEISILDDVLCTELSTFQGGLDLCGGPPSGGLCFGDSGGPLMVGSGADRLLTGVISRGPADCVGHPGIFTRLSAYADWIFTTTQSSRTTRSSGTDRYITAAGLAAHFAPGVPAVYLVTGEAFPDAVAAAAAAGAHGSPVLLTKRHELPEATQSQLARLAPQRLVVVGGTAAISDSVAHAAAAAAGVPAERVAGPDRYATAAALSSVSRPAGVSTAFLAVGTDFPDAVTSGPVAGAIDGGPVLLTEPNRLPPATADELRRLSPHRVVILGGTAAVSSQVLEAAVAATPAAEVTRIRGADRYATAAALSAATFAPGVPEVYVATGVTYPDALASGPVAASRGAPVLLVDHDVIPASTANEIRRLAPARIVVLGGIGAVPAETAWALDGLLAP